MTIVQEAWKCQQLSMRGLDDPPTDLHKAESVLEVLRDLVVRCEKAPLEGTALESTMVALALTAKNIIGFLPFDVREQINGWEIWKHEVFADATSSVGYTRQQIRWFIPSENCTSLLLLTENLDQLEGYLQEHLRIFIEHAIEYPEEVPMAPGDREKLSVMLAKF